LELVRQIANEITIPAFAIGGVDLANVGQVISSGIGRVAVAAAVMTAEDPSEAAKMFIERLKS
jgi:thiamine-phosphate pyrophosphorylase